MISRERVQQARDRASKATAGPWVARDDEDYYQCGRYLGTGPYTYEPSGNPRQPAREVDLPAPQSGCHFRYEVCRIEGTDADEAFIAHARTDVPDLAEALEEMAKALAEACGEHAGGLEECTCNGCSLLREYES